MDNNNNDNSTFEVWKAIKGHKDYYVSNFGRVLSRKRGKNYFMQGHKNNKGYLRVDLDKKFILIHRLVMEAFVPIQDKSLQVNHKDLNKENNRLDNLEWVTAKENVQHALKNGCYNSNMGMNNNMWRGSYKIYNADNELVTVLITNKQVKDFFNERGIKISSGTISTIVSGKRKTNFYLGYSIVR